MDRQPIKKVKYLPWILAAFALIIIVSKISDWRVQTAKSVMKEQFLVEASNFVNAIDNRFFYSFLHNETTFNGTKRRYLNQWNSYQTYNQQLQIYGLHISDTGVFVAVTPEVVNSAYKTNEVFTDHGNLLEEVLRLSKPLVSEPILKPHGLVISVIVPVLHPVSGEIFYAVGIDYPSGEYLKSIKQAKLQSVYYLLGIIFLLSITIFLVFLRDRKPLTARKKYRHIETISVVLIGMALTLLALFLSDEYAYKEKESAFVNLSSAQTSVLRTDLRKIRSSLEVFANFFNNSDIVDSTEFASFASQLLEANPVESFLWFEGHEFDSIDTSASKQQLFSINNFGFNLRYKCQSNSETPINAILEKSQTALKDLSVKSLSSGITEASDAIKLKADDHTSYILVMIPAFSNKINSLSKSDKSGQKGFLVAIVSPQSVFNFSFNKHKWNSENLNIGLIDMNMENEQQRLASFPEDHILLHHKDNIAEHLKDYNHHQMIPMFAFGRSYGIISHTTLAFERQFGTLRVILISLVGLVFTFLLAFMVMLWRNRWHDMEKLVDVRTAELQKSINDLKCLKAIGEEMNAIHSRESLLSKVNILLSAAFNTNENINVYINFRDQNYGWTFSGSDNKKALVVPLMLLGKEVGNIIAETKNNCQLSQNDQQLIDQVALMVSRWLEHNEISESLKESEEKFRSLIESAFDSIYILQDKHFTYVNKAFVDLVGYSKEELTDPNFDLDVLLTEKSRELVNARMEARKNNLEIEPRYEFQQLSKSGVMKDVEVSTVSIKLGGQRKIMGILRDITERKKTEKALIESEERLQQQNEELQVLNEELIVSNSQIKDMNQDLIVAREKAEASDNLKTAFLNNISHEVRTPLNGIVGATILMADRDSTVSDRAEMSYIIQQSSQRLIRTITQYMDISLLNSGNMPLIINKLNLVSSIKALLDEFGLACQKNNLKFEVNLPVNSPEISINSDKSLIEKVLYHLLDNAVKFTKEGSVVFKLSLQKDFVEFDISDTGIGIDKEFQENIFDHFTQEDSSNLRQFDGSGLGLAICKKICNLLGARISFRSVKGQGTRFIVELPYDATLPQIKPQKISEFDTSKIISPFILIAEDEDSNFIVLSLLLQKKLNARIIRAVTGREAVDLCNANPDLQLILMDIKMPVMDGFEATRLIKIEKPDLAVIAITAYGLSGDEYKSINAGCDDYIAKPVNAKDLIEKVKRYLKILS
ncbi:MAG: ATP-binding protein [Bacteroidales bacterium]|nr:ATP-binding protein [Bacteroidales bacterium]